jgi:hypothetical protein
MRNWMTRSIATGQFIRTRELWIPERWDDGVVDNRGYFRVYRPDYPRCFPGGYAKRSHVVWWLETGQVPPLNTALHHLNGDKLDDRFVNLALMAHGAHTREHSRKPRIAVLCNCCGREFLVAEWKIKTGKGKFCSRECFNATPRKPKRMVLLAHQRKQCAH